MLRRRRELRASAEKGNLHFSSRPGASERAGRQRRGGDDHDGGRAVGFEEAKTRSPCTSLTLLLKATPPLFTDHETIHFRTPLAPFSPPSLCFDLRSKREIKLGSSEQETRAYGAIYEGCSNNARKEANQYSFARRSQSWTTRSLAEVGKRSQIEPS